MFINNSIDICEVLIVKAYMYLVLKASNLHGNPKRISEKITKT